MSNIDELIEQLRRKGLSRASALGYHSGLFDEAADALSTLQAENEEMQKKLNEFSEFLCHMTGGMLSKTNYTAQEMVTAAEDYQQKVCGECDLRDENEKLRGELERMKKIMRDNGIMVIPSKYPGGRSEWNIPKPCGQKED